MRVEGKGGISRNREIMELFRKGGGADIENKLFEWKSKHLNAFTAEYERFMQLIHYLHLEKLKWSSLMRNRAWNQTCKYAINDNFQNFLTKLMKLSLSVAKQ